MNPPPFDPPYFRVEPCPEGMRTIETREDGSEHAQLSPGASKAILVTRPSPAPATSKPSSANAAKPARSASSRASLFLKVPFAEKDQAKKLGARWDAERRAWYVPQGVDITPFKAWWPEELK